MLCSGGILCGVHSFVHSGSGVEFVVKFVLNEFDLAVGFRGVFVLDGFSVVVWALSLCSMGSI